jgi:hypothetical protein
MTYKVQIDDLIRNANAEETAAIKANEQLAIAEAKIAADKLTAKAALLEKLGITADEAALLLS